MDRPQRKSELDLLDPIIMRGPIPLIPSQLEVTVAVFSDELPTWDKLCMLKRYHHLRFSIGGYPRHVKYVNQHCAGTIKDKIMK